MGDVTRGDAASLILDLNRAAVGDVDWADALAHLARLLPGVLATFEIMDRATGAYVDFQASALPDVNEEYLAHYCKLNPRLDGVLGRPHLVLMADHDFLSEAEIDQDEFYNDFLAPHGMRYCAGVRVLQTSDRVGTFSIQRAPHQGHVDTQDLAVLRHLQPHMAQAARTYLKFDNVLSRTQSISAGLDRLRDGIFIIGGDGKAVHLNAAAEAICRENDGLALAAGRLAARSAQDGRALDQAIGAMLKPACEDRVCESHIAISRPSGRPPYIVTVAPAPRQEADRFETIGAAAILIVADPTRSGQPATEILKDAYGLSPAEAEVASDLANGHTARQIADDRGVSIATVRSQIQSVLQKTGLRRQSDLVRLLSRLDPAIW